ncbi:MAG: RNA methyltransferase [Alphaproteobacteria bacterium]|nr:RNA methyltransferase [Alphaproteobacteria bacterium]MBU1514752.1 RNA methyltransferase [Alphaproteobacteria bacterium]MBU2093883.1 RNA methyltransferase [Alphaproteobacteria bacterium]MBU2153310.1 RNA methyltransferase [Alphaproteobacteria bacterium]MBU2309738.1 RNA methyltransferase [Alphaproteobacteria bacterium]
MPTVHRIDDPGDPRLEPYRAVRERDLVGRDGLFVAEGRVVLEKAVAAMPAAIASVLVAEHRLDSLAQVLAGLPPETPVYAAGQAAMDAVVGFPIHRGILAVGRKPDRDAAKLIAALPADALVVGLVGIANHDNMGGIFRNAAAFGADAVLLDETCCDPLYRKAIRVSVGAALTVPFARAGDAATLVSALDGAGFETVALSPRGEVDLGDLMCGPRVAALFGAEGPGLPNATLARTRAVRIAMAGGFDSLNVATTSGIVLHHLAAGRARRA